MKSLEDAEEFFLRGADKCPSDGTPLKSFKKFRAGTEFVWLGWCDKCNEDKVTIHGNNPVDENPEQTRRKQMLKSKDKRMICKWCHYYKKKHNRYVCTFFPSNPKVRPENKCSMFRRVGDEK